MRPWMVLRFRIGTEWFALPAAVVRRIALLPEIRPVPRTPPFIRGLAEFGGRLVTVLDPALLIRPEAADPGAACAVLLETPYQHLALSLPELPRIGNRGGKGAEGRPAARILAVADLLRRSGRRMADAGEPGAAAPGGVA